MKINWETGTDMVRRTCGAAAAVALLVVSLAVPAAAENYFLYAPKAVNPEEKESFKAGVLVREVAVHKGDTLSGISRRFSGRGSYYPQILLFNDIRNPNLIYRGATLKVPVTKGEAVVKRTAASSTPDVTTAQPPDEISASDLKPASNHKINKRSKTRRKHAWHQTASSDSAGDNHKERLPVTSKAGRKLFNQALRSYHREDCTTALALFDRFLSKNPSSPLAAEASLYKADCYLKQSSK